MKTMWWGYLHQNGTIQCKRWLGDTKDYTDDCDGNPFVIKICRPFYAIDRDEAVKKLKEVLGENNEI